MALGLTLAACSATATPPDPRTAAVTSFPGLARPTSQPLMATIRDAHPAPGSVTHAAGPFDDRFALTGLRLVNSTVMGTLTVTSDVSELIDLQVVAGFYNAAGTLLGTAVLEKHGEGARPNEVVSLKIAAPAGAGDAVSASVGVPVLVNE